MEPVRLTHMIDPVYDEDSEFLLLGSFPSVKSREQEFFYGHPQNRFWKIMSALFGEDAGETKASRKAFLLRHHIAVWDVIQACTITGSSDSSIRDVTVTDLRPILENSRVGDRIFVNGGKAHSLYMKYTYPALGIPAVKLPSSSPANAAWSLDRLIQAWGAAILPGLRER